MKFRQYFAERAIRSLPAFAQLAGRFPGLEWIDDYQAFRKETMRREKECVILAAKRGRWLKPFHCYFHNTQYRYFGLDLAEGCAYDCVYCYLQTYLNHGALVLFVDTDSLEAELREASSGMWISTGLLADSLLAESAFPVLPRISRLVAEGALLELRTKSAEIACLEDPSIARERLVVSWSLNPQRIAQRYEYGAAPAMARLEAARKAVQLGYRIGFHLDPVFHYDGWLQDYAELIRQMHDLPMDRMVFLSLGLFRYMPDLGSEIRKRFPFHEILTGEFFPDEDGKYHYFRAIRRDMHRAFREWLQPWSDLIPVFWSMEPEEKFLTNNPDV
ncbi:MAG TPA: hypothetical protein VLR94_00125 [Acidobacteriota bacterium]|nr:hypothetical protein [Acidobacteriota bacterium]